MLPKRLLTLILFTTLALAGAGSLRAQWKQTNGVYSGDAIAGLAVSGQNLVAGATPGARWINCYFSTDGGTSWKIGNGPYGIGSFITIGKTFFGLMTVYGSSSIFRSTDDGLRWNDWSYSEYQINSNVTSLGTDSVSLFAGTLSSGIYIYDNSGETWTATNAGLPKGPAGYPTIRAFATIGTMLFAGTDNGLFRSTNHGKSWQSISDGPKIYYGCAGIVISDSILIYADIGGGVFTSTDSGTHWSPSNIGMTSGYIATITANGPNVFVGTYGADTNGLYRSTNNGRSWSLMTNGLPKYTSITAIAFCASKIFAGTKCAGVYVSSDSGLTWSDANNSGLLIQPRCSEVAANEDGLYAGFDYFNLFRSTDDGANWTTYGCDNGGPGAVVAFGTNVYVSGSYSTDGGLTWKNSPYSITSLMSVGRNFFGGGANGVLISTDSGTRWTSISSGLVHNGIQKNVYQVIVDTVWGGHTIRLYRYDTISYTVNFALRVNSLGVLDTILFAATQGGIFYSTDYGSEWLVSDTTLKDGGTLASIGTILFLGTGHGVLMSADKGTSWKPTISILIDSVTSILAYGAALFASTEHSGVYLSKDNGSTWIDISAGLTSLRDWTIRLKDSELFIGTDSGLWRRPLSEMLPQQSAVLQPSAPKPDLRTYPNPFSQSTTIPFTPEASGYADVSVVNLLGVEVARLFAGELTAGEHTFTWDAATGGSAAADATGMYECVVRMNGRVERLKLMNLGY